MQLWPANSNGPFFHKGPDLIGVIGLTYAVCRRFNSNPDGKLGYPDYVKGDNNDIQCFERDFPTETLFEIRRKNASCRNLITSGPLSKK